MEISSYLIGYTAGYIWNKNLYPNIWIENFARVPEQGSKDSHGFRGRRVGMLTTADGDVGVGVSLNLRLHWMMP